MVTRIGVRLSTRRLSGLPDFVRAALATTVGGSIDAWVYLAHGHVFAVAQSGNVALMGIALSQGRFAAAGTHLPSLMAFIAGLASTHAMLGREWFRPSMAIFAECLMLVVLGISADRLPQAAITAAIGFIAGVQMTALATFGRWNIQSAIITGDLRQAVQAVMSDPGDGTGQRRGSAIFLLCATFVIGAGGAAWLTPRLGGLTLCISALLLTPVAFGANGGRSDDADRKV